MGEGSPPVVSILVTVISAIGDIVDGAVDWLSAYLGAITDTGNDLLLFFVVFSFVGVGIGLLRRLSKL